MAWGYPYKKKPFSLMGLRQPDMYSGYYPGQQDRPPGAVPQVEGTINQRFIPVPSGIDGGLVAGNARVASGTTIPQTKKFDFSKLEPFRQALEELDPGPVATAPGGKVKFGRGMPAALGFSLTGMGGRLGEQQAMAQARREEELQRRRKLLGGGY